MIRCCAAVGCGTVLGILLFAAVYRVSEQFDTQLIPF